jgi:hypothetical protein
MDELIMDDGGRRGAEAALSSVEPLCGDARTEQKEELERKEGRRVIHTHMHILTHIQKKFSPLSRDW